MKIILEVKTMFREQYGVTTLVHKATNQQMMYYCIFFNEKCAFILVHLDKLQKTL